VILRVGAQDLARQSILRGSVTPAWVAGFAHVESVSDNRAIVMLLLSDPRARPLAPMP